MYKILLVEDDAGIAKEIADYAAGWGIEVHIAKNFENIMAEFAKVKPHLVLLDISLPYFDGYYWCSQIRNVSKIPIIFLSSASDNMNILMAMNMGADDFIAKPFDRNVLIAKLSAMLRRSYDFAASVSIIEHKGAMLNMSDNTLTYQGKNIDLSKNEYKILLTLMENRGKVVSRESLMERLWESDSFVDENTLTVNVNRLRKKLDNAGLKDFIGTKFGVGYIVQAD